MKLEHLALQVPDPVAMADWYTRHLGFRVARSGGEPSHARFLMERGEAVMLEVYRNPLAPVPDYFGISPLLLHLAFVSDNPAADRDRLVKAGAKVVQDLNKNQASDELVMLRDPWGVALQLVRRAAPMLEPQSAGRGR